MLLLGRSSHRSSPWPLACLPTERDTYRILCIRWIYTRCSQNDFTGTTYCEVVSLLHSCNGGVTDSLASTTSFQAIGTPPPKRVALRHAARFRDVRSTPTAPALTPPPRPHAVAAAAHTAALATCFPPTPCRTPVLSQELANEVEPLHDPPTGPSAIPLRVGERSAPYERGAAGFPQQQPGPSPPTRDAPRDGRGERQHAPRRHPQELL